MTVTKEHLDLLDRERSGTLATVRPDGTPHVVPVVFAVMGGLVVTAIDWKPKTTRRLARLVNVEANPKVSLLVDHYSDEDWELLWWLRMDGLASVHDGDDTWSAGRDALTAKYRQYRDRPPEGPVIAITPERITHWTGKG